MTAPGTPGEESQAPGTGQDAIEASPNEVEPTEADTGETDTGEAHTAEADAGEAGPDASEDEYGRNVIDLLEPADGLPPVITTAEDLAAAVARLAAGTGPVAVDAERASGYRYGQRAYLVQLRRAGAGTVLIDPIACPDLSSLGEIGRAHV